jgi:hypothetical protein
MVSFTGDYVSCQDTHKQQIKFSVTMVSVTADHIPQPDTYKYHTSIHIITISLTDDHTPCGPKVLGLIFLKIEDT